jgi:hypothetical protein
MLVIPHGQRQEFSYGLFELRAKIDTRPGAGRMNGTEGPERGPGNQKWLG